MQLLYQIIVVIEIVIMNISIFYKNTTPKYSPLKTVMTLFIYTIILITVGYNILIQFSFFGNGNALFTLLGFLYLPILNYLFEENYRDNFFIMCFVWIYTLSAFSIGIQIAGILNSYERFLIVLIAQTLIFSITYRYMIQFVRTVYVKLLDCQDLGIRKYLDQAAFIWFSTILIVNLNFIFEGIPYLKIIAFIVILINVVFNYLLLYEILSKCDHIGALQNQIAKDTLTQIGSRIGFENFMNSKIKGNQKFALIYLDLDRFKDINDNFGHLIGDQYLKVFARELDSYQDIHTFRISGDEFIAICEIEKYQELMDQISKINFKLNDQVLFKGVSIGHALYPSEGKNIDKLIHIADQRMYKNKNRT